MIIRLFDSSAFTNALNVSAKAAPEEELDTEVKKFAENIASKSKYAIAVGKEPFYEQVENKLSDAYDLASDVMVRNMLAEDAEEGIGAFLGKRNPEWSK